MKHLRASSKIEVSPAKPEHLSHLPPIERSAATLFLADPALAWLATEDSPTLSLGELDDYRTHGVLLVAIAETIRPASDVGPPSAFADSTSTTDAVEDNITGFLAAKQLDNVLFVAEMSVAREWQGFGVGSKLLEKVQSIADGNGTQQLAGGITSGSSGGNMGIVSLTTDRLVTWNGPWYRRRGFVEIEAAKIGEGHVGVLREELQKGMEEQRRSVMVRATKRTERSVEREYLELNAVIELLEGRGPEFALRFKKCEIFMTK